MNAPSPPIGNNHISEEKSTQPKDAATRRATMVSAKPRPLSPIKATGQNNPIEVNNKTPKLNRAAIAIQTPTLDEVKLSTNGIQNSGNGEFAEDEQSHLSNSSTKQHSFETKSMGSVTTFAMDEKESIRPDDSASVRAADDEDVGSTLSRNSTFQNEPDVIMPPMRGPVRLVGPNLAHARRFPTLTHPPRFGDLETSPISPEHENLSQLEDISIATPKDDEELSTTPAPPDEKLLDALASPKDRIFILQVEEKLLMFMSMPNPVPYLDFPPQNAWARLLVHKTADYHCLHHWINEDGASIRIFRNSTPGPRPTPLSVIAKSIPMATQQPLGSAAVKIMRRAGVGPRQSSTADSTAASSSVPSKATSEAGVSEEGLLSPMEGTPNRDKSKMTREEREAQYKAARDRIFGDFQELSVSESASTGDNSASISRSSSSSGKKKSRKQKQPKDDSFEARSAFIPSYGPIHMQQMQTPYPSTQYFDQPYHGQFEPQGPQFGNSNQFAAGPMPGYSSFDPGPQFNQQMPYNSNGPQSYGQQQDWSNVQSQIPSGPYHYPQSPPGYQQSMAPMIQQMNQPFMQQQQASQMQQQGGWNNNQFQNPFPGTISPPINNVQWPQYQPPPFGAAPAQHYGSMPSTPQPAMPMNQNRSLFNPQTRSFVPGTGNGRNNGRTNRRKSQPIGVQRQNSSFSRSSASDNPSNSIALPSKSQTTSTSSSPQPREESLQQKYGKPANLPKKPPPSQVSSQFDTVSISAIRNPGGSMSMSGGERKASPSL